MKTIKGLGITLNMIAGLYLLAVFIGPFRGEALPIVGEWVGQAILSILLFSVSLIGIFGIKRNLHHLIAFTPLLFYLIYFFIYGLALYVTEDPRFLNQVSYRGIIALKIYGYLSIPLFVIGALVAFPSFILKKRSSK